LARKIIIDCDPGIDDAAALCMALFAESLDVVAVTAVEGNVTYDRANTNLQTIIEQLDPPKIPRLGMASPNKSSSYQPATHIHGMDGLGDAGLAKVTHHHSHPSEKILLDKIRSHPGEISILCLGPLTNIASVLKRDPDISTSIREVIMMGGSVSAGGNITPTAEFNMYCDPHSAAQVFESDIPKALVPLDVTQRIGLTLDFLDNLPGEWDRRGALLRKILPSLYRAYHNELGQESINLHDAVAVLWVLMPDLFESIVMAGKVETIGEHTRGATIFDRRNQRQWHRNVEVVIDVDVNTAIGAMQRILNK